MRSKAFPKWNWSCLTRKERCASSAQPQGQTARKDLSLSLRSSPADCCANRRAVPQSRQPSKLHLDAILDRLAHAQVGVGVRGIENADWIAMPLQEVLLGCVERHAEGLPAQQVVVEAAR